ncbi:MAG: tetratricopeptide repeat protein [Treponema sp.]|jgi:tetratricopeptide (TPR) repeat protein|nr:tetratricopeptide repeat protein [Treponema sp.]
MALTGCKGADAEKHYKSGEEHREQEDYDLAVAGYTGALRLKPDLAKACVGRGLAYFGKEDYDRAIPRAFPGIR